MPKESHFSSNFLLYGILTIIALYKAEIAPPYYNTTPPNTVYNTIYVEGDTLSLLIYILLNLCEGIIK